MNHTKMTPYFLYFRLLTRVDNGWYNLLWCLVLRNYETKFRRFRKHEKSASTEKLRDSIYVQYFRRKLK